MISFIIFAMMFWVVIHTLCGFTSFFTQGGRAGVERQQARTQAEILRELQKANKLARQGLQSPLASPLDPTTPPRLVVLPTPTTAPKAVRKSPKMLWASILILFTVVVVGTSIGLPMAVQNDDAVPTPTPSQEVWKPTKGQLEATEHWKKRAAIQHN